MADAGVTETRLQYGGLYHDSRCKTGKEGADTDKDGRIDRV
jgi:hypothetical protein